MIKKQRHISWFKVVSLIAVLVLPLIYGFLYLWAFWDPYSALKNMPVAVVNLDKCAKRKSEQYCLGDKLVDKLKENTSLGWRFVSKDEAEDGLNKKTYYSIVTIQENFSVNALSADSNDPQVANLLLTTRQATNFMAAKFSETAMIKLTAELNREVEEEYWKNVYVSMREIGDKMGDAAGGAYDLRDGLGEINDGNKKITDGLGTTSDGAHDLNEGLDKLKNGSNDLKNGLGNARTGASTLTNGLNNLNSGLTAFASSMGSLQTGINQVQGGVVASKTGIDQAIALIDDPNNLATVKAILTNVSNGLGAANSGISTISSGIQTAGVGVSQLTSGSSSALSGANSLATGLGSLYDGSVKLDDSLASAKDGASKLKNGLGDLIKGCNDLGDGIEEAKDGAKTLAEKLNEGSDEILRKSSRTKEDSQVPVLAEPVKYATVQKAPVANNGTGFAPYFIPLALWVGAMSCFFIFEKPEFTPKMAVIFGLIGVGQAVLLAACLMLLLGMKVLDVKAFLLFGVALSWCYMLIQALTNHLFGEAGKFFNILLLMLQITSSAGSYPLETSPDFFRTINPFLPMTYAVDGLREIISGGDWNMAWGRARVIVTTGCVFLVINIARQLISNKMNYAKSAKKN